MEKSLFEQIGVSSRFTKEGAILKLISEKQNNKVEVDFKDCPDLLLPFAVACLCSGIKFRFSNVSHLRLKESDRLESLKLESKKLGFIIKTGDNFVEWDGEISEKDTDPIIDPHDDHRVAMAFAMAALKFGKIRISDPRVVEKSFIDFWNQLPKVGLVCEEADNIMTVSKSSN